MSTNSIPPLTAMLGGQEYKLQLSMQALYVAERVHKFDITSFDTTKSASGFADMMEILWIAALHHQPGLKLTDFLASIGFDEMEAISGAVENVLALYGGNDEKEKPEGDAKAKKPKRSTSTRSKKSVAAS